MRQVARAHGAPFCINEVVLNETVLTPGRLRKLLCDLPASEHPVGGQLMGSDPEAFGPAARVLVDAGYDLVDINFGCPVPKVLGRCRGGYLLSDPDTALEMVERVLQAVAGDVPVTVKMRRGIDREGESEDLFFRILDGAFDLGIDGVTVHGRSVLQRYQGSSDWGFLARVKRHLGERTMLGSGDLFSPYDIRRMVAETGVDGVTVARGAIGNPWIFAQYAQLCAGMDPLPPTVEEQRRALEMHREFAVRHYGERKGPGKLRAHAIKYAAVHPEPMAVRDAFVRARNSEQVAAVLERYYGPERAQERSRGLVESGLDAQSLKSCGVAGGSPLA